MTRSLPLHWQIMIGLVAGVAVGIGAIAAGIGDFIVDWVSPIGTIFVNLLKLIAIPLVFSSLVCGIVSLPSTSRLSQIGGKTLGLYLTTTFVAASFGIVLANAVQPGQYVPDEVQRDLQQSYDADEPGEVSASSVIEPRGPLDIFVHAVPENAFDAFSSNMNMLQVVVISILLGLGIALAKEDQCVTIKSLIADLNEIMLKVVNLVMKIAPFGVFSLLATMMVNVVGDDFSVAMALLGSLGFYTILVAAGLLLHVVLVYGGLIRFATGLSVAQFFKAIVPAQLVALSTTSAAATLPVSMDCVERRLGIRNEIAAFVLPVGATVNLDGTAMYQSISAIFIAQALGIDLTVADQTTIVLTALLASIGTAPVPGAGVVMLVMVLESVGIPSEGLALIIGVDRILDMLRTSANVTGDCTVAAVVASWEGDQLPSR